MNATESHQPSTSDQQAGLPRGTAPWPPTPTPEQERAWREPARPSGAGTASQPGPHAHPVDAASSQYAVPQRTLPSPVSVRNLATWAIVLGIVSLFFNPLAVVSIAAGWCAILALTRASTLQGAGIAVERYGMAVAGLVMAIVGFASTAGFKLFLF